LQEQLAALHDRTSAVPYGRDAAARGARKLKTQALVYLAAGDPRAKGRDRPPRNMTPPTT
jgi:aminopeptidase N